MYRSRFFLLLFLLALTPPSLFPQEVPVAPEPLWSWSGNCSDKRYMGLEIVMSGKVIDRSSFPICPVTDLSKEIGIQPIVFSFRGGHVFQGEYHTVRTQTIEGNIWLAGTDPGAILLGVSFSTGRQILLNTIHVAKPGGRSTSEIDRGLIVRTFPISAIAQPFPCFSVHGRYAVYTGDGMEELWIIGTHRLLLPVRGTELLEDKLRGSEHDKALYGDFTVCPLEKDTPGAMRKVAIQGWKNLKIGPPSSRQSGTD